MRGGVLWGRHPAHVGGGWLKLSNYTKAAAETRTREGWETLQLPRGSWPPCECGAQATCSRFSLLGEPTRYECRPCQTTREARECGCCSGRGTLRDARGMLTAETCKACAGSGLNPNQPSTEFPGLHPRDVQELGLGSVVKP